MSKNGQTTAAASAVAAEGIVTSPKKEGTRWKARTIGAIEHLAEKFPGLEKECKKILESVKTLDEKYAPNPVTTIQVEVGQKVRLPNHEKLCKTLKIESVGTVKEVKRGMVTVELANGVALTVVKAELGL